jgi:hypothetical protein
LRTQKGSSKRHKADEPEPIAIFNDLDFTMPIEQQDAGDDIPWEERLDLPPDLEEDIQMLLTKHWNQFCSDILQKCGNVRGQPLMASHCRLSLEERRNVTDTVYQDLNLAMVFNRVQWKKVSGIEWKKAFDIYFPSRNSKLMVQPQNFPSMAYWLDWHDMRRRLPPQSFDRMRSRYWTLFKKLLWIPKPHGDRLWKYIPNDSFTTWPVDYRSHAPHVIVSPSSRNPTWQPHLVPGEEEDEEEEENGEEEYDPEQVPRREWVNGVRPIPRRVLMAMREESEESE